MNLRFRLGRILDMKMSRIDPENVNNLISIHAKGVSGFMFAKLLVFRQD
jgi:hypothetical protein